MLGDPRTYDLCCAGIPPKLRFSGCGSCFSVGLLMMAFWHACLLVCVLSKAIVASEYLPANHYARVGD